MKQYAAVHVTAAACFLMSLFFDSNIFYKYNDLKVYQEMYHTEVNGTGNTDFSDRRMGENIFQIKDDL